MSITCVCSDPDSNISHYKCDQNTYGPQIVALFYQKPEGADFDGTTNNDGTLQADWNARLASTGVDKISVIPYLANAVIPEPEDTLAEDNEVAYGGQELEDRKQMLTFDLRYLNAAMRTQIDLITNCTGLRRIWFMDNKGWIYARNATIGGINDASILMKSPTSQGIGSRLKIVGNTVTWHDNCTFWPMVQLPDMQAAIDDLAPSGS